MKDKILSRKFMGNLNPSKTDANFEKAHLKAYIAGKTTFHHGFVTLESGHRIHARHEVKQEYLYI